jgi:uncharacterized membrane protein YeaQ/YmgE (transglycosylase-associated protein family)
LQELVVVGAIAGWLAGKIVKGAGFGLIGNIVIGIIGAAVASWLLPQIGVALGGGFGCTHYRCCRRRHGRAYRADFSAKGGLTTLLSGSALAP